MLSSCSTDPFDDGGPDLSNVNPGFCGGDGSPEEQAVVAIGLDYSAQRWIGQKYPGSTIPDVSLVVSDSGKRYDVYRVKKRDGKTVKRVV